MRSVNRSAQVRLCHYKKAIAGPSEYIKYYITDDPSVWYVLLWGINGDSNEYVGGQYLVRLILPNDFPFKPPEFYFMTKQGLYGIETKVCISIGEFHSNNYPATLGVKGFCEQLVSGLIGWKDIGAGISIINTTAAEKKKLALQSVRYNQQNNKKWIDLIENNFQEYSKKWNLTEIPEQIRIKLGLGHPPKPESVTSDKTAETTSTTTSTSENFVQNEQKPTSNQHASNNTSEQTSTNNQQTDQKTVTNDDTSNLNTETKL